MIFHGFQSFYTSKYITGEMCLDIYHKQCCFRGPKLSIILVKICDFAYFRVCQYLPVSTENTIVYSFQDCFLLNLTSTTNDMNVCYNVLIVLGLLNIHIGKNMPFCHIQAPFVVTNKVDANMIFKQFLRFVLQEFDFL